MPWDIYSSVVVSDSADMASALSVRPVMRHMRYISWYFHLDTNFYFTSHTRLSFLRCFKLYCHWSYFPPAFFPFLPSVSFPFSLVLAFAFYFSLMLYAIFPVCPFSPTPSRLGQQNILCDQPHGKDERSLYYEWLMNYIPIGWDWAPRWVVPRQTTCISLNLRARAWWIPVALW
jgi:hypothetical protein